MQFHFKKLVFLSLPFTLVLFILPILARSCTNKYFKYYRCNKSSLYSSYAITLNAGLGGTDCTTVNGNSVMTSIDLSLFHLLRLQIYACPRGCVGSLYDYRWWI